MGVTGTLVRHHAPCPSCGSDRDLASHPPPVLSAVACGAVAIMFTDIEGSSAMTERLGDGRWAQILQMHNAIVRGLVLSHGGVEVSAMGDGFMILFPDTAPALACALEIQQALGRYNASHLNEQILLRIALHSGEVLRTGRDYFGRSIVVAARIADHARGGEIVASEEFVGQTAVGSAGRPRELELKGLRGIQRVQTVERG